MPYFKYEHKNVFYEEIGSGKPLFLLHGNTASSAMFTNIIQLYSDRFKVILIDFLGHGKSDRLTEFPVNIWFDEAMQVVTLIEQNNYSDVYLIGTSGGALVALNVALERGDLVSKVIADSFEGETALDFISEMLPAERAQSKKDASSITFWEKCHGSDWESVIDNDTKAAVEHAEKVKNFFHNRLSSLNMPVLLTASLEDEYAEFVDFQSSYRKMLEQIPNAESYFFETGGHPAMLTSAKAFSEKAQKFFLGKEE